MILSYYSLLHVVKAVSENKFFGKLNQITTRDTFFREFTFTQHTKHKFLYMLLELMYEAKDLVLGVSDVAPTNPSNIISIKVTIEET